MAVYCIKTSLNSVVFANSILCLSLVARYRRPYSQPNLQLLQRCSRHRDSLCAESSLLAPENLPATHRQRHGTPRCFDRAALRVLLRPGDLPLLPVPASAAGQVQEAFLVVQVRSKAAREVQPLELLPLPHLHDLLKGK